MLIDVVLLRRVQRASAVHADDRERPALVELEQQPLVRILRAADAAPVTREDEQHDLPAVVAEFERRAVVQRS